MGHRLGKLIRLAWLLVRHGEAIEADLLACGVDLLDFYAGSMSIRRLWVLVSGILLVSPDPMEAVQGTALSRSVHGELGDWSRLDRIVGGLFGVKPPTDKAVVEWKQREQARIKAKRAERAARRAAREG